MAAIPVVVRSGALVPDFAARLAAALGVPFGDVLACAGGAAAAAQDGQRAAAGRQRARRLRGDGRARRRAGPAGRRRPLQRLDVGDGRWAAAREGRRAGLSVRSGRPFWSARARATREDGGGEGPAATARQGGTGAVAAPRIVGDGGLRSLLQTWVPLDQCPQAVVGRGAAPRHQAARRAAGRAARQ